MDLQIIPVNDTTVYTDNRNGRKYTITHHHMMNGVKVGESIQTIPMTDDDRIKIMAEKGRVFSVPVGIGIVAQGYLYLYPNETVHNGCGDGEWCFDSVEQAESFLTEFKLKNN